MLAEHHDIFREFPEYRALHDRLRTESKEFDALVARHDYVDDQIRNLEEKQTPVSDQEIEKLKFERASLKDQVFETLKRAAAVAAGS
ncbi:MAG: YdcH family protein [Verrucomicrobiales bacterium]|nr:DUF465 domain-containing protein [Verrucomicrobiota bacterium JB025]